MSSLILKNRSSNEYLTVEQSLLDAIFNHKDQSQAKDALWEYFRKNYHEKNLGIHDKVWMTMILNWTPEGGISLSEMVKLIPFTERINSIDETKDEIKFNLSNEETKFIWDKLRNPNFKIIKQTPQLIAFLMDLQKATGESFDEKGKTK